MATEKRLISADSFVEDIKTEIMNLRMDGLKGTPRPCEELYAIIDRINEQPTVDAVEVVRCKDCKWYKEGKLLAPNKFCFRLKHPTENRSVGYNFCEDDFCSYGERKDNVSITD